MALMMLWCFVVWAKTRLMPALSSGEARYPACRMVADTVRTDGSSGNGTISGSLDDVASELVARQVQSG